jgi:hypothetical protein
VDAGGGGCRPAGRRSGRHLAGAPVEIRAEIPANMTVR